MLPRRFSMTHGFRLAGSGTGDDLRAVHIPLSNQACHRGPRGAGALRFGLPPSAVRGMPGVFPIEPLQAQAGFAPSIKNRSAARNSLSHPSSSAWNDARAMAGW